jgi:hypothetical protein
VKDGYRMKTKHVIVLVSMFVLLFVFLVPIYYSNPEASNPYGCNMTFCAFPRYQSVSLHFLGYGAGYIIPMLHDNSDRYFVQLGTTIIGPSPNGSVLPIPS